MEEIKKDIDQAALEFDEFQKTFEKQKQKKLKNKKQTHELLLRTKDNDEQTILEDMESVETKHKDSKEDIDKVAEIRIEKLRAEKEKRLAQIQDAVQSANRTFPHLFS
jgi:hypothetical protein